MAATVKSSDKHSMTSSDLGSSCDNDVDASTPCDAKGKLGLNDVMSVDGSASLTTLDSLEEEDSLKTEEGLGRLPSAPTPANTSDLSDNGDGFYLHGGKDGTNIESCKDRYRLSDLAVHSEQKATKGDKQTNLRSSHKNGTSESVSVSSDTQEDSERRDKIKHMSGHCRQNADGSTHAEERCCVSTPEADQHLCLQKSQSPTNESSSDPSPKHPRRSGIPRRKYSDQSLVTAISSARSTPQNSPASLRRSLTLNSASLNTASSPRSPVSSPGSRCNSPASFPQTPVRIPKLQRSRSASHSEALTSSLASFMGIPGPVSRDTLTSRLRFEKRHSNHDHCPLDLSDTYLTPYQRKDLLIRELRGHVKQLNVQLENKEREMEELRAAAEKEEELARSKLQGELEEARKAAEAARKEVTSLQESHEESVKMVATLQQQLEDVKRESIEKLAQAEEIFLEMYNKGRESAIFEREEELELQAKGGRSPDATETELRNKLVRTQAELAKWQTIQRHESYHTMPVPGTEAETTLRFLKDSVFHFLTTDKKTSDEHLRAIVRILRFSEVQREKIAHAIIYKRNKSGW